MTIETKYNIDDEVWYKGFKNISYDKISNIHIEVDCLGKIHIDYELWNDVTKNESEIYPTKQELLNSVV